MNRNVFDDPISCLNQAKDLYELNRTQQALSTLIDFVQQRRYRGWSEDIDNLISFHLLLSFQMKDILSLRNAALHFKNICQQAHIESLKNVVFEFFDTIQQEIVKTENSGKVECTHSTPEIRHLSLISLDWANLSSMSRVITASVKCAYLAYFNILEIFSGDFRMHSLYHSIAQKALSFCTMYDRRREFRRICFSIHTHVKRRRLASQTNPQYQPDPKELLLNTYIEILNCAERLGISQEALRAAEEINKLSPSGRLRVRYYRALTKIFRWGAHNYNAYVHLEMFRIQKRTLPREELRLLASQLLCAILSTPPWSCECDLLNLDSPPRDTQKFLCSLLPDCRFTPQPDITKQSAIFSGNISPSTRISRPLPPDFVQLPRETLVPNLGPTRDDIMKMAAAENIDAAVYPELAGFYADLTAVLSPGEFVGRMAPRMEFIGSNADLAGFYEDILESSISHYMERISSIYDCVRLDYLADFSRFVGAGKFQRIISKVSGRLGRTMRIDLAGECLEFRRPPHCGQNLIYMSLVLNRLYTEVVEKRGESAAGVRESFARGEEEERAQMESRVNRLRDMAEAKNRELGVAPPRVERAAKFVQNIPQKVLREPAVVEAHVDDTVMAKIHLANMREKVANLKATRMAPKLVQSLESGRVSLEKVCMAWINEEAAKEIKEETANLCRRQVELDRSVRYYANILVAEEAEECRRRVPPALFFDQGLSSCVSQLIEARNRAMEEHAARLGAIESWCPQFLDFLSKMRKERLDAELVVFERARLLARQEALALRRAERKEVRRQAWQEKQRLWKEKLVNAANPAGQTARSSGFFARADGGRLDGKKFDGGRFDAKKFESGSIDQNSLDKFASLGRNRRRDLNS